MARKINNKKAKGIDAERELLHKFWEFDWACIRVAGSGSSRYPSPDVLASNGFRKIVMEVKVVNGIKKYFTGQEIRDLNFFGERFGAESWVGIRFQENQWFFLPTSELIQTKSLNYSIDLITMKRKGFTFEEMLKF